jgi:DNA polymerase III subunit delta'
MKKLPYEWLVPAWNGLLAMRQRMPHALLIYGPVGIGKRALAEHFAQSLLCENPTPSAHPCGECGACRWFADGNHPDYRVVLPAALQPDPEPDSEGEGEPGAEPGVSRSKTAPSKVIKIGQVRGLDAFLNIGTHRAGRRVVLIYPADTVTADAGNALLKTLEEPPPNTLFLLVTSHINEMLPTIRSRCAKYLVDQPDHAPVIRWLRETGVARPELALAEAGGVPLAAAVPDGAAEYRDVLLSTLAGTRAIDPVVLAEKCDKAGAANVCLWMSRWVSDLVLFSMTGKVRYHPGHQRAIADLGARVDGRSLIRYYRQLMRLRRIAEHPLNPRLFVEDLLIDYARLMPART